MPSLLLLLVGLLLHAGSEQTHLAVRRGAQIDTVLVRGVVFDSIAGRPLVDANVQLAGVDSVVGGRFFTARTDSVGAFVVRAVPAGRYVVGFFHPALDTLGFEARELAVDIRPGNSSVALATPSAQTLVSTLCGADTPSARAAPRPGLLIGHLRDVRTESAVVDGTVTVVWADAQITSSGVRVIDREGVARTRAGGWFALCGVPREVPLTVRAGHGEDSSGAVQARVPAEGLRHLTLSVGSPKNHRGRIVGRVLAAGQRPVTSAQIALVNSDRETATTNAGEFVLDSVPVGTQSLGVRAIGYSPTIINVQVDEDRPTRTEIVLERVVALPTMTARDSVPAAHLAEFLHDKKADASGSYFVQPIRLPGYEAQQTVCSLIAGVASVSLCTSKPPGVTPRRGDCEGFILNGTGTHLDLSDLDPSDILGVEVLRRGSRFAEEIRAKHVCAIAVWTRCPGFAVPTCRTTSSPNTAKREEQLTR